MIPYGTLSLRTTEDTTNRNITSYTILDFIALATTMRTFINYINDDLPGGSITPYLHDESNRPTIPVYYIRRFPASETTTATTITCTSTDYNNGTTSNSSSRFHSPPLPKLEFYWDPLTDTNPNKYIWDETVKRLPYRMINIMNALQHLQPNPFQPTLSYYEIS